MKILGLNQLPQMFIPLSFALCFHIGVGGFIVIMQSRLNETPPVLLTSYEVVSMDAYGQVNSNLIEADTVPIKEVEEIEPPVEVIKETPPPVQTTEETPEVAPDVSSPPPLEVSEPIIIPKAPKPILKNVPRPMEKPKEPMASKTITPLLKPEKIALVRTEEVKKTTPQPFQKDTKPPKIRTEKPTNAMIGSKKAYIPPSSNRSFNQNKKPTYPSSARRRNMQGTVLLHVVISKTGTVKELNIIKSSKFKILDMAALKAVKRWRFTPALQQGKPVEGSLNIPILFKLNK